MTNPDKQSPWRKLHRAKRFDSLSALLITLILLAVPTFGSSAETLRIAVISDLNGAYGSTHYEATVDSAVARILEIKPSLVISTGDMVAGQRRPHLTRPEVERMWSAFHTHVSEPLAAASIPLAVTPGNHDGSAYAGFMQERTIYAEQWQQRIPYLRFIDKQGYPFYYAFSVGDVLFISLDATTVGHLPSEQMDWLRRLLASHGPTYRQRVVFSHLPLWPFTQDREREFIGDPALEALLTSAGITLYLSGHHHAFYPGIKAGIAFVSQSCLGAGPRRLIGTSSRSAQSFTLLEFTLDTIYVAAYMAPRFKKEVDWATLPRRISTPAAELVRADLVAGPIALRRMPAASENKP